MKEVAAHHCHHSLFTDCLVLSAGAAISLAFAPYNCWILAIILPIILFWSWDNSTPSQATRRGLLFGLGMFGFGIYWVYISLHDYGGSSAMFAFLSTLALVILLSLYLALAGWLTIRWGPPTGLKRWLLFIPALFTFLEWVRGWLFTGFPWLSLGYSQIDAPLGRLAPYLGVLGVGWAVMFSTGILWVSLNSNCWQARIGWIGLLTAIWLGIWELEKVHWTEPTGSILRISIIQGNIPQEEKWQMNRLEDILGHYMQLSLPEHGHTEVIIWPETAIPTFYQYILPFIDALGKKARKDKINYIAGIPTGTPEDKVFYNSVISIGESVNFYSKRRLLPFGEYLPLQWFFKFFRAWVKMPMADFLPGEYTQPLLKVADQPVGVSICFEVVFGNEIRLALPISTWLINVSNDAWFKDSIAAHQHLQIARMRSLETGRYMARATNTGISAIIDDHGRIIETGPQFQAAVVRGSIQLRIGQTPYVYFGDLPIVVLAISSIVVGLLPIRLNRRIMARAP
jgi:apolipoprotein N-acyltransferase